MSEKNTAIMKNWSITTNQVGWIAPELVGYKLQGNTYADGLKRFADGDFVMTSTILSIEEHDGYKTIETKSTVYKVYPDDIDPMYEANYPNAYERLRILRGVQV